MGIKTNHALANLPFSGKSGLFLNLPAGEDTVQVKNLRTGKLSEAWSVNKKVNEVNEFIRENQLGREVIKASEYQSIFEPKITNEKIKINFRNSEGEILQLLVQILQV